MKKETDIFTTNPEKASSKVAINSFMMGSLFFILTLIWMLDPQKFSIFIISQIVLAIPLLFVSSLAYSKIGYWKEIRLWDALGWFTNTTGNAFILNVVGLITATVSQNLAFIYFVLLIALMAIYTIINGVYKPHTLQQKLFKFVYFVAVLVAGGVAPVFFH